MQRSEEKKSSAFEVTGVAGVLPLDHVFVLPLNVSARLQIIERLSQPVQICGHGEALQALFG